MDRGARRATVPGVARAGRDLATTPPPPLEWDLNSENRSMKFQGKEHLRQRNNYKEFILVSFPIYDAYFIQNLVAKSFLLNGAFCVNSTFQLRLKRAIYITFIVLICGSENLVSG